jgi:hypothetical protein
MRLGYRSACALVEMGNQAFPDLTEHKAGNFHRLDVAEGGGVAGTPTVGTVAREREARQAPGLCGSRVPCAALEAADVEAPAAHALAGK